MASKENDPQMALILVGEILLFAHIYIYIYRIPMYIIVYLYLKGMVYSITSLSDRRVIRLTLNVTGWFFRGLMGQKLLS